MEVGNIKLNWKNLMWRDDIFIMPKYQRCVVRSEERYVTAVTDFLKNVKKYDAKYILLLNIKIYDFVTYYIL